MSVAFEGKEREAVEETGRMEGRASPRETGRRRLTGEGDMREVRL